MNKTYPVTLYEGYAGATSDINNLEINGELKLLKKGSCRWNDWNESVCFDYALDKNFDCIDDAFYELEQEYKRITLSQAKEGDIITYHGTKYLNKCNLTNIRHFAIIKRINKRIENIIIKSKWGRWGVYECKVNEVPMAYGENIAIWSKK